MHGYIDFKLDHAINSNCSLYPVNIKSKIDPLSQLQQ